MVERSQEAEHFFTLRVMSNKNGACDRFCQVLVIASRLRFVHPSDHNKSKNVCLSNCASKRRCDISVTNTCVIGRVIDVKRMRKLCQSIRAVIVRRRSSNEMPSVECIAISHPTFQIFRAHLTPHRRILNT